MNVSKQTKSTKQQQQQHNNNNNERVRGGCNGRRGQSFRVSTLPTSYPSIDTNTAGFGNRNNVQKSENNTEVIIKSFEKLFYSTADFISFDDFNSNLFYCWYDSVPFKYKELTVTFDKNNIKRYRIRYEHPQTKRMVSIKGRGTSKKEQLYEIISIISGRQNFQMDVAPDEPAEPMIETVAGNTEIVSDTPPAAVDTTDGLSRMMKELCNTANDFSFPTLTDRWNLLEDGVITTTAFSKEIIVPRDLFTAKNAGVTTLSVFKNFVFSDTELEIRMMVNCPKFSQGRLIISWFPDPTDLVSSHYMLPSQLVQRDHVFLDLAADGEAIIRIPQQYRRTYVRNLKTDKTANGMAFASAAAVQIATIVDYECGSDQPGQIPYQLFYRFTKAELSGMSYGVEYQMMRAAWDTASMAIPEVAMADKWLKQAGVINNQDKPPDNRNQYVTPRARYPVSHGKGLNDAVPLTMDPYSTVTHDASYFASNDPKTTLDIASKWGLHSQFLWEASKARDKPIYTWQVNPVPLVSPWGDTGIYPQTLYTVPTPLAMATSMYAFWRGEIDVKLVFVGTQFHTGTIQAEISFNRGTDDIQEAASTYTHTIKVGAETEFEFSIPYVYDTPWRPTHDQLSYLPQYTGQIELEDDSLSGNPLGLWLGRVNEHPMAMRSVIRTFLKLTVVNPLNPLAQVIDHMTVLMFVKAGKGYEMHSLINSPYSVAKGKCQQYGKGSSNGKTPGYMGFDQTPLFTGGVTGTAGLNSDRAWDRFFVINEDAVIHTFQGPSFHTTDDQYNIKDICKRSYHWGRIKTPEFAPAKAVELDQKGSTGTIMQRVAIPLMIMNMLNRSTGLHSVHEGSPLSVISTLHRQWRGKIDFTFVLVSDYNKPIYFAYVPNRGTCYNGIVRTPVSIELFYGKKQTVTTKNHNMQRRLASAGFAWEMMIPSVNRTIKLSCPFDAEFNRAVNCIRYLDTTEPNNYNRVKVRDDSTGIGGHIYIETDDEVELDVMYSIGDDFEFYNFIGSPLITQDYFFNSDTNYEQGGDPVMALSYNSIAKQKKAAEKAAAESGTTQTTGTARMVGPTKRERELQRQLEEQKKARQEAETRLGIEMTARAQLATDIQTLRDNQTTLVDETTHDVEERVAQTEHTLRQQLAQATSQADTIPDLKARIERLEKERAELLKPKPTDTPRVVQPQPTPQPQPSTSRAFEPRTGAQTKPPTFTVPVISTPLHANKFDDMTEYERRRYEYRVQNVNYDKSNFQYRKELSDFITEMRNKYGEPFIPPDVMSEQMEYQMDVPIVEALGVLGAGFVGKKVGKVIDATTKTVSDFSDTMKGAQKTMSDVSTSLGKADKLTEKLANTFGGDAENIMRTISPALTSLGAITNIDIRSVSTELLIDLLILAKDKTYSTAGLMCTKYVMRIFDLSVLDCSHFFGRITDCIGRASGLSSTEQGPDDETNPWSDLFAVFVALVAFVLKIDTGKISISKLSELRDSLTFKTASGLNQTFTLAKRIFITLQKAISWTFGFASPEAVAKRELKKMMPEITKLFDDIDRYMCTSNQDLLQRPQLKAHVWQCYSQAITVRKKLLSAQSSSVASVIVYLSKWITFCHEHFPVMACCPAKYESFIIAMTGKPELGKSYITKDLSGKMLSAVGFPLLGTEYAYFHSAGKKHFDGYRSNHQVFVMDDWMNPKYPEDCADTLRIHNQIKSPAQFIVPMASIIDKGLMYRSRLCFQNCNNAFPRGLISIYFAEVEAILRRRDRVIHAELTEEWTGERARNIPLEILQKFEHLKFRYLDIITGEPISDYMTYQELCDAIIPEFVEYDKKQREIIKHTLIMQSKDLPEIFRDVEDPLDFFSLRDIKASIDTLPSDIISKNCKKIFDMVHPTDMETNIGADKIALEVTAVEYALSVSRGIGLATRWIVEQWLEERPETVKERVGEMLKAVGDCGGEESFWFLYDFYTRQSSLVQFELACPLGHVPKSTLEKAESEVVNMHKVAYEGKLKPQLSDDLARMSSLFNLEHPNELKYESRFWIDVKRQQFRGMFFANEPGDAIELPEITQDRIDGYWNRVGEVTGVNVNLIPTTEMEASVICCHCGKLAYIMYGTEEHHVCHKCFSKSSCIDCPPKGIVKRIFHKGASIWFYVARHSYEVWKKFRDFMLEAIYMADEMVNSFIVEMQIALPKMMAMFAAYGCALSVFWAIAKFVSKKNKVTKKQIGVDIYLAVLNEYYFETSVQHNRTLSQVAFKDNKCYHQNLLSSRPEDTLYIDGKFVVVIAEGLAEDMQVDLPPFACGKNCILKVKEAEFKNWCIGWIEHHGADLQADFDHSYSTGGIVWESFYTRVPPMFRDPEWDLLPDKCLFDKYISGNLRKNPILRRLVGWIDTIGALFRKYEYLFKTLEAVLSAIGTVVTIVSAVGACKRWFSGEKAETIIAVPQSTPYDKSKPRTHGYAKPKVRAIMTKVRAGSKFKTQAPEIVKTQSMDATRDGIFTKIWKNLFAIIVEVDGKQLPDAIMFGMGIRDHESVIPRHYLAYIDKAIQRYGLDKITFKLRSCYWPEMFKEYPYDRDHFSVCENMDLAVFSPGPILQSFCNIKKYFATDAQLQHLPRMGSILFRPLKEMERRQFHPHEITIHRVLGQVSSEKTGTMIQNVIHYNFSMQGACGSPLLLPDTTTPIVGFHIMGTVEGAAITSGYATVLTRDVIDDLFPGPGVLQEDNRENFGDEPTKVGFENWVRVQCLGSSPTAFMPAKTKLKPSLIAPIAGPSEKRPAFLSAKDPGYPHEKSPLVAGCEKHGKMSRNFSNKDIQEVSEALWYGRYLAMKPLIPNATKLSYRDAVGGLDVKGYEGMELDKSMGYPWVLGPDKKKSDYIYIDKEPLIRADREVRIRPELMEVLEDEFEQRKNGIIPKLAYLDWCKDELRKHEKANRYGGTRIFCMAPASTHIAERRNFLHFSAAYKANRIIYADHAVGISVNGPQWGLLADTLLEVSPHIVTIDYSDFGPAMNMAVNTAGRDIINRWTRHYVQGVDDTELEMLKIEHTQSVHLMHDLAYRQLSGAPSGGALTVENNGVANEIYLLLAWKHLASDRCKELEIPLFTAYYEFVKTVVYGDDVIMAVSEKFIDVYNTVTITQYFGTFGITATDANKSTDVKPYTSIYEATFLKCGFVEHPTRERMWLAPLEKSSFMETANWIHKSINDMEMTESNAREAIENAFGHGKEVFNSFMELINRKLVEHNFKPIILTWESLDDNFFNGIPFKLTLVEDAFMEGEAIVHGETIAEPMTEEQIDAELALARQKIKELEETRKLSESPKEQCVKQSPYLYEEDMVEEIQPQEAQQQLQLIKEIRRYEYEPVKQAEETAMDKALSKAFGDAAILKRKPKRKVVQVTMIATPGEWLWYERNKNNPRRVARFERMAKRRYLSGAKYINVDSADGSGDWERLGKKIGGRGNVWGQSRAEREKSVRDHWAKPKKPEKDESFEMRAGLKVDIMHHATFEQRQRRWKVMEASLDQIWGISRYEYQPIPGEERFYNPLNIIQEVKEEEE